MARHRTKRKVNLLVRAKWDGRMGTTTEVITVSHGRKGFRGYVGPHDTIRRRRSPKHKVIPGSQGQPLPQEMYKVAWHSAPRGSETFVNQSGVGGFRRGLRDLMIARMHETRTQKDYYSQDEITILTKETQNGET